MTLDDAALRFLRADDWPAWREMETEQRRGVPPPPMQKPHPPDAVLVDLVPPGELTVGRMPLIDVLRRRRSRRAFDDAPLSLEELSFLLWATQGLEGERAGGGSLRTVPSGGARHPFETYLAVQRVTGVRPGIYRYLPQEHKLCLLRAEADLATAVAAACGGQRHCGQAAVTFFWAAIPARTAWRYAIVAPKIVAQDSGHLCQNLYLAAESIGAGTCAIGAYDQGLADALIGVDGRDEFVIYAAPVGKIA